MSFGSNRELALRRFLRSILVIVILSGAALFLLVRVETLSILPESDCAQDFVDGLMAGSTEDETGQSGYDVAWSLMDQDWRQGRTIADLVDPFENMVDKWGFLEDAHRDRELKGLFDRRRFRYEMATSGLRGRTETFHLEVLVIRTEGVHRVAEFLIEDGE